MRAITHDKQRISECDATRTRIHAYTHPMYDDWLRLIHIWFRGSMKLPWVSLLHPPNDDDPPPAELLCVRSCPAPSGADERRGGGSGIVSAE